MIPKCIFEQLEDGSCVCVRGRCGRVIPPRPGKDCSNLVTQCRGGRPGPLSLVSNYSKSITKRVRAGRKGFKKKSRKEKKVILKICESNVCGLYDAEKKVCQHKKCGCKMNKKAMWKMEECPMGFWK